MQSISAEFCANLLQSYKMAMKRGKKRTATSVKKKTPSKRNTDTSQPSTSRQRDRPGSPLCPTRLQEKTDLQHLNDRLACYIEKTRQLKAENSRLTRELQTKHGTVTSEVTSIKSIYENELADARSLLDESARERAKLEIDAKRLREEKDDLQLR
jgi:lamin B